MSAQARRRRHGRRLPRRGPGARTQGRRQDAPRALRERRAVRRAVPPRGDARGRPLAPEHRLDLRPWRGRRLVLHRHGVRRGAHAQGADPLARARARSRWRSPTRARSSPRSATRTATASSTATSSRTTSSSTPEGVVKVTDFGIARAGASQMTEEGAIIGTAQYLSPEQARGAPVDQTSDLYSDGHRPLRAAHRARCRSRATARSRSR